MAAAAEERRMYADGRFRSGSPPERLTDGADIIYRQHDNSAPAPVAEPEYDWSAWEAWMAGHLANFREEFRDELFDAIAEFGVRLIEQERVAVDRKLAELRAENIELKGMLATTLRQLNQTAAAEIVDLSIRRRSDAA
jgi:hypothetical protein